MTHTPPSADQQIRFLTDIQRFLDEGGFVATYKYALLHTLADLCLLHGDDSGAPLELSTGDIAAGYIDLYWRQTLPYPQVGGLKHLHGQVLKQNTGEDPAIIKRILEAQPHLSHTDSSERGISTGFTLIWETVSVKVVLAVALSFNMCNCAIMKTNFTSVFPICI